MGCGCGYVSNVFFLHVFTGFSGYSVVNMLNYLNWFFNITPTFLGQTLFDCDMLSSSHTVGFSLLVFPQRHLHVYSWGILAYNFLYRENSSFCQVLDIGIMLYLSNDFGSFLSSISWMFMCNIMCIYSLNAWWNSPSVYFCSWHFFGNIFLK